MRIAINGFGRIGRCITRLLRDNDALDLVAINDPGDHEQLVHLLRYDSTHGPADGVKFADSTLRFGRQKAVMYSERDPKNLPNAIWRRRISMRGLQGCWSVHLAPMPTAPSFTGLTIPR
jgi:glyceraldehyde-3-phosphate dehydrogenase/erythrose-4-phosphate dehydrogenase